MFYKNGRMKASLNITDFEKGKRVKAFNKCL